jgi:WD40 repeat protein
MNQPPNLVSQSAARVAVLVILFTTCQANAWQPEELRNATGVHDPALPALEFSGNFFRQGLFPRSPQTEGRRWQLETRSPRSSISSVAWHPSGDLLAAAYREGSVRIYETGSWQLQNLLYCDGAVSAVAYSPDGNWLATTSAENPNVNSVTTLRIWQADGTPVVKTSLSFGMVSNISWSPDSKRIATAGYYRDVMVYDLQGNQKLRMEGHRDTILHVDWNLEGDKIASASRDGKIRVWELLRAVARRDHDGPEPIGPAEDRNLVVPFTQFGEGERMVKLSWMTDSETLVCGDFAGRVYLRKADGQTEQLLEQPEGLSGIALDRAGQRLAISYKKNVILLNVADKSSRVLHDIGYTKDASWHPQKDLLALPNGNQLIILDVANDRQQTIGCKPPITMQRPIVWGPEGTEFTFPPHDGWLRLWNAVGEGVVRKWQISEKLVWDVSWSPNNRWLTSYALGDGIQFWTPDGERGPAFKTLDGFPVWSPDGERLALVSIDGSFRITDGQGKVLFVHLSESRQRNLFQWSPHSDRFAIAGTRDLARIVLLSADGKTKQTLPGDVLDIVALSWHPQGERISVIDREGNVRDWNLDGTPGRVQGKHEKAGAALAWSPYGKWLASSSVDLTIWNADGESMITVQQDVNALLNQIVWHPDSSMVAALVTNSMIRIWTPTGEAGPMLYGNALSQNSIAWSPGGELIVCSTDDHCVIVWDAKTGATLWIGIELENGASAVVDANGMLTTTDLAAFDEKYVFVEYVDGKNVLRNSQQMQATKLQKEDSN